MSLIKTYKDLEIWQKGIDLTFMIYDISANLPPEEKYGLISQMRRSAVSFPSNTCPVKYGKAVDPKVYLTG